MCFYEEGGVDGLHDILKVCTLYIYRVAHLTAPPKKFKYGKPRLREVRCI